MSDTPMIRHFAIISAMALCVACTSLDNSDSPPPSGTAQTQPPPARQQTPRAEPRSRYGNPPSYVQFGRTYTVLDSAAGYREQGIASWYGKKFHGKRTSSGETYDMFSVSAAHKTLPIPCWVRVTNLDNQRSMLIRVNDRGPFVDDRLIDLSYAAANALGIVEKGTGRVEVEAVSFDDTGAPYVTPPPATQPVIVAAAPDPQNTAAASLPAEAIVDSAPVAATPMLIMQIGAFASFANAERQLDLLVREGIDNSYIEHSSDGKLYRVRIDKLASQAEYVAMAQRLRPLGITRTRLVKP
ncbi:MAG: septal ring lytic transglycosylase RlpA family protein [Pseudomonadota bacterium]